MAKDNNKMFDFSEVQTFLHKYISEPVLYYFYPSKGAEYFYHSILFFLCVFAQVSITFTEVQTVNTFMGLTMRQC